MMNSVRTYLLPRLLSRPSIVLSPVESCFGTSPIQAPKSRPAIPDCGHYRASRQSADPRNAHQPPAARILARECLNFTGHRINPIV